MEQHLTIDSGWARLAWDDATMMGVHWGDGEQLIQLEFVRVNDVSTGFSLSNGIAVDEWARSYRMASGILL